MSECPYGNLLCEFPEVEGTCVYCAYPDPFDAHCPNCHPNYSGGTWHIKTGREGIVRCVRCNDIHPFQEGVIKRRKPHEQRTD